PERIDGAAEFLPLAFSHPLRDLRFPSGRNAAGAPMVNGLLCDVKGAGHLGSLEPAVVHEASEFFGDWIHEENSSAREEKSMFLLILLFRKIICLKRKK